MVDAWAAGMQRTRRLTVSGEDIQPRARRETDVGPAS
jgi:hypothetical protein